MIQYRAPVFFVILLISLIGITMFIPIAFANQVSVTAHLDRTQVTLYERISYSVTVESSSRSLPDPIVPEFKGFRSLGSPRTSSQFSWVNGQVSNSQTYTFILEARQEGRFTFEPAVVEVSGQVFKSAPLTVTVLKPGNAGSAPDSPDGFPADIAPDRMESLFLEAVVDNETPFVGEGVTVSFHLFTRVNIRDFAIQEEPDYQGFWVERVELQGQPTLTTRQIRGVEYGEAKIHEIVLYPTVSGELMIPPLIMAFQIQSNRRDTFDQFFNSPFNSGFFGAKKEIRSSPTKTLQVRPLPGTGKPSDFGGAVGQFRLESTVKNDTVKVGEAVVVTITLSGNHGLKTIAPPRAPSLDQFKIFEPKADEPIQHPDKPGWHKREYEYILVPHQPGDYTIPGFTFTYFDSSSESYETLSTESIQVSVGSAPHGEFLALGRSNGGKELQLLNTDIRYIKTRTNIEKYTPVYKETWFLVSLVLPVLAIPVIILVFARRRRMEGDSAFARELLARSVSVKRFLDAQKAYSKGDFNRAMDCAASGYSQYLADRLNLPPGGVTLKQIVENLIPRGIDDRMSQEVQSYWNDLEMARYGPVNTSPDDVLKLLDRGRLLVEKLEKVKTNRRKKLLETDKAGQR